MDEINQLFETFGNEKYLLEEPITQKAHALQSAWIAQICQAPPDVIIALLLHDIGQITNSSLVGQRSFLHALHDELGAKWLTKRNFPSFVVDFALYHTMAKIALCDQDPCYFQNLSKASQESFHLQKAKYIGSELYNAFIRHPRYEDFLAMRRIDDLAKSIDPRLLHYVPPISFYAKMVENVLSNQSALSSLNWKELVKKIQDYKHKYPEKELWDAFTDLSFCLSP